MRPTRAAAAGRADYCVGTSDHCHRRASPRRAPRHALGVFGSIPIRSRGGQHIFGNVIAQKRGEHHKIGLQSSKVFAQQTTLVVFGVAAHARVHDANIRVTRILQLLFEHFRKRLLVGHLATHRVTVAEHDDTKLTRGLGRGQLWTDHPQRVGLQHAVIFGGLEPRARTRAHHVARARIDQIEPLLRLQLGASANALQSRQVVGVQVRNAQPDLRNGCQKHHGYGNQHDRLQPREATRRAERSMRFGAANRRRIGTNDAKGHAFAIPRVIPVASRTKRFARKDHVTAAAQPPMLMYPRRKWIGYLALDLAATMSGSRSPIVRPSLVI